MMNCDMVNLSSFDLYESSSGARKDVYGLAASDTKVMSSLAQREVVRLFCLVGLCCPLLYQLF